MTISPSCGPLRTGPWPRAMLLGLVLSSSLSAPTEGQAGPTAVAVRSITAKAIVDRTTVGPGERVTLRIAVHNSSDSEITNLKIQDLATPGFDRLGPGPTAWSQPLPIDATAVFRVDLMTGHRLGPVTMSAQLSWASSNGQGSSLVTAPPVTIESPWSADRLPGVAFVSNLAKDFALPVLIAVLAAVLGWWFNRSLRNRSEQHETYKQIFTQVLELSRKHYMHIGRASRRLLEEHCRLLKAHQRMQADSTKPGLKVECQGALARCFAALVVLLHYDLTLQREAGCWFLQNRRGEDEVFETWLLFQGNVKRRLPRQALAQLLDGISEKPEIARLIARFEAQENNRDGPGADWHTVKNHLDHWLRKAPRCLHDTMLLLRCFFTSTRGRDQPRLRPTLWPVLSWGGPRQPVR